MPIAVGDTLPDMTFKSPTAEGATDVTIAEFCAGRTVVLFAVPGAFTPTCDRNHLPGFLAHREAFAAKGVHAIGVTAVNDVHVMKAWLERSGAMDKIVGLADGSAEFARKLDLVLDATAFGMGLRSKRYAMLVKDRVVSILHVEDMPGKAEASSAEALLAKM
jgi:peroxiredoxin